MLKLVFNYLIGSYRKANRQTSEGFTLTELLVVVIIGGLIVSSLMTLVVQLVATEQKESAKTETQREMQLALDYIASDLRQAVYVYDGEEHTVATARQADKPSYLRYLPNQFQDDNKYRPVLAFWKPEPIDIEAASAGSNGPPAYDVGCNGLANANLISECNNLWLQRRAYTLVVYFEVDNDENDPNEKWQGLSRIERFELPKYVNLATNQFARNAGFVDPAEIGAGGFLKWPFAGNAGREVNCQTTAGDPCQTTAPGASALTGSVRSDTLVDFVDSSAVDRPGQPDQCPGGTFTDANGNVEPVYLMMPRPDNNRQTPSFFACIRNVLGDTGAAQDVRVYLRGNAQGRGGGVGSSFLPTLESRITMRGIIDRSVNQ